MNIVIMSDEGEPEYLLEADKFLNYWFWDMEKADRFSAYIDLIFLSNDEGILLTTTKSLASRWKMSTDRVRKLLRLLRNHRFIKYERARFRQVKITILIPEKENGQC